MPPRSFQQGNNTTLIAGSYNLIVKLMKRKGPQIPGQAPSSHCSLCASSFSFRKKIDGLRVFTLEKLI